MDTPLISIIVPVYKVEKYLDECVQSIVDQTYENLEIILVDDGSPDQCPQMCDDWAQRDSRIKVIHKSNGGASSARNAALDIAQGDYIGFVDSDDYIAKTMFEDLLLALKDTNVKISHCGMYRVLMTGESQKKTGMPQKVELRTEDAINAIFYNRVDTAMWSKLFEKCTFDDIRFPEGEVNEEFSILVPLIVKAGGVVCTGKTLYYYRVREGSVTSMGYSQEKNSDIVYRNLDRIKKQLSMYHLNCQQGFRFFAANVAYFRALVMEKKYPYLSDRVKQDYWIYRKIMRENTMIFVCSHYSNPKDKMLYILVLTRLLRPVYKVFYKDNLL